DIFFAAHERPDSISGCKSNKKTGTPSSFSSKIALMKHPSVFPFYCTRHGFVDGSLTPDGVQHG
ncbi:MAG: hypothetical protein LBK22_02625, partial [Tannerella sp.]|nr:hypothetical protein [Tannerella sp.]